MASISQSSKSDHRKSESGEQQSNLAVPAVDEFDAEYDFPRQQPARPFARYQACSVLLLGGHLLPLSIMDN